jgi:pentatricopeptide repeat protein
MRLYCSSIENDAYPFQNHRDKPSEEEEEVTKNKSNGCSVSGQLDETQDLLFGEFSNLSETQTEGVRHKDGLGTVDDLESDMAQFGVDERALEGFKGCADVLGRVGKRFEGRTGDKSRVLQGFKRAEDEIRAFKRNTSRTESESRNLDVFMDAARDKGRIIEGFQSETGIESRVLPGRVLEKDVDLLFVSHSLLHNAQWFEAERRVFEGFKNMNRLQGGILERRNAERMVTASSEFQHQNLMKIRTEGGVLGELSHRAKLEPRICNARKNDSRSYADDIGMHMVQSLGKKMEENLRAGGKDMPISMESLQDKKNTEGRILQVEGFNSDRIELHQSLRDMPTPMESLQDKKNKEGRILQVEGLNCDRVELHQSLREIFNTETNTEGHCYPRKRSEKSILVKLSSGCRNITKKMETKRRSPYNSYGGCIPAILQALDSTENIDEALAPWEANLSAKERSIILKEQWDWGRAVQIFKWFQRKECYEVNVIHYNILLRILGRAQKWDQLKKFWEEMVKDKVLPTTTTYGTLINVYGKAGLKEEALLWLDHMISQGLWPDEVIVNTVVHIFKKAREFEKAEQFFRDWSSGKIYLGNTTNVCSSESEPDRQQQKDFLYISRHCEVKIHFEDPVGKRDCTTNIFPKGVPKIKGLLDDKCMDPCRENHQVQRPHSSYMYNTLIDTYGKAGRLKEASKLFSEMLKEGISPNIVTFNTMIHICGSYGYLDEADALMAKMEELHCLPDTRTYNTLIALHAQNDNIDKAFCYFTKMKEAGLVPDTVGCRTILYAFCIRHMVSEVEAVVREMDALDVHVDEYSQSAAIRMYIDLGMLKRAWAWFERFHLAGGMSCECYAANIDAYGERGYWLEAEKVFNCSQEKGESQTVLEFNVMIKAYGIAKLHDKVLKLFERMKVQGVLPDRCTYASVIQTLASSELVDVSEHFITKMQEAGFVPNCASFCAVIAAYGRLGQAVEAEKMFGKMIKEGVEPDVFVYGALINAFAEAGCVEEAVRYFQIMQDAGFAGNLVVYSSLIKVYSKRGLLKEAQETYKSIQKLGVDPGVFVSGCMLDLYTRADMVTEAQEVFKALKEKRQANEFSFAMMLSLYKKNGRLNEATEIAKEMLESGFLTDVLSFNSVISLFIADGRLREAAKVFHQMLKLKVSPNETTYKTLGILLKKGGIPREAVEQLDVARKSGLPHGIQALTMTIYSVVGMHAEALGACDELKASGLDLDVSSYNAVIYAFGSAGRINEAFKMFMSMQAEGLEPDTVTYASMIITYGKRGLVDGVRRMFYKMKQKGFQPNEFTFKAVIDAYKSAGKFDLARFVTQEREFMHQLEEHGHII